MAKFRVEMLNGDVYQLEGVEFTVSEDGHLVIMDYRNKPEAMVLAGQWRLIGEWLKAQKMEVQA